MCNELHRDYKKIKSSRYGYKIFDKNDSSCFGELGYDFEDGWIKWDSSKGPGGFCFFASKKEAFKLLKQLQKYDIEGYSNHCVKKIQYKQGLGKHFENIVNDDLIFEIAICKEFKILELVVK